MDIRQWAPLNKTLFFYNAEGKTYLLAGLGKWEREKGLEDKVPGERERDVGHSAGRWDKIAGSQVIRPVTMATCTPPG